MHNNHSIIHNNLLINLINSNNNKPNLIHYNHNNSLMD